MPLPIYTGEDVIININAITKRLKGIDIQIMRAKFEASASDADVEERGSGRLDAKITLTGFDSDDTNAATYAQVAELVITQGTLSALSWTDKGTTPASRLPASFAAKFPLAKWRIDDAAGGSADANKPGEWKITLTPNNLN